MNIIILITLLFIAISISLYAIKIEKQQNKEFKDLMKFLRKREKERLKDKNIIKKYTEEKSDF